MIYLIYGNQTEKVRNKVRDIVSAQIAKKPDALSFRINTESWPEANLEELLSSQGLFVQKYIVIFETLLRHTDAGETLLGRMNEFSESEHIFIFAEGELTKEILKKVEKRAAKVQEIATPKKEVREAFNIFALADSLGRRDKKELWVLYEKAIASGKTPEEIHPILSWQVRAMLGAEQSESPEEAGLSPYVYKKAQSFAQNFSRDELTHLSSQLLTIYHDARRGMISFDTALLQFILTM
jgi:DNA polymerase III delta subunit